MLCSAAAGPAAVDEEIAHCVHAQLTAMRLAFGEALKNSSSHAGLNNQKRSELEASLLSLYIGVRVLVRSNAPIELIELNIVAINRLMAAPTSE
jgi:hypothetical protein